jgi:hypothetical protein
MSDVQHEAYRPLIEDGRGIFPEDFRVKAPSRVQRRCAYRRSTAAYDGSFRATSTWPRRSSTPSASMLRSSARLAYLARAPTLDHLLDCAS